jgi:outer membrane protein OmpA-like peptidoglycan-associated protein
MSNLPRTFVLTFLAAGLTITGCATKKHVRSKIQPLEIRLDKAEEKGKSLESAVADLEKTASRADERAKSADSAAGEASKAAQGAADRAGEAQNTASTAKSLAESSVQKSEQVERQLGALSSGIANLQMAEKLQLISRENVLFGVGSVSLSKVARDQLDALASKLPKEHSYAVELQGFADPSGQAARNLELSQKRAESVARYLSSRHSVPLYSLHVLGMGSEKQVMPAAQRRLARRVEVKLYSIGAVSRAASVAAADTR